MKARRTSVVALVAALVLLTPSEPRAMAAQDAADRTVRVLLDVPPRAVEYQLNRLTNDELARVERKPGDPRYRPVYLAILTRRGLAPELREESIGVLAALDGTSRARVLAEALARVPDDDQATAGALLGLLFAEPQDGFARERATFAAVVDDPSAPVNAQAAAYGALLIADGRLEGIWPAAEQRGHAAALVRAAAYLPWRGALATAAPQAFARVAELIENANDEQVRADAMGALVAIRPDAEAFQILAAQIAPDASASTRDAAVHALGRIPRDGWRADRVEPVVRRLIDIVRATPEKARTEAGVLDAIGLGHSLTEALPTDTGRALRRELRALGVIVVRLASVREELRFDRRWFVVQAGRPVEIVFTNPDTMPHNVVVGRPGSLEEIGRTGSAMAMPSDPAAKPFVPDSPLVLYATTLVNAGEQARLRFAAPKAPGEYPFVCTFPGHWLRMYGVMVVVDDLDAWEATPAPPVDPLTKKPFDGP